MTHELNAVLGRRIAVSIVVAIFGCDIVIATAGELAYSCEIHRVYDLAEDSTLAISGFDGLFAGMKFSVSRVTGEIIGGVLPTIRASSIKVINGGSDENSFKTVAEFDGAEFDGRVQVLEVQEWRDGNEKPFVSMSMGGAGIVTGFCE